MSNGIETAAPPPMPPTVPPVETVSNEYERFIENRLQEARRHVKGVDVANGFVTLAIGVLAYLLLAAVVDHWLVVGGLGLWGRLFLWAGLVGAAGVFFALQVWPPLWRRINPVFAASTIEKSEPTLHNSLINFLLLRGRRQEVAPAVYRALEHRAASDLSRVKVEIAIDRSHLVRLGCVLAALTIIFALYVVISPKSPLRSAARVLFPWSTIEAPTRVTIREIQPGDHVAFLGDKTIISAEVAGLGDDEKPLIVYSTADGQIVDQTMPMTLPDGGYRYQASFPPGNLGLQQNCSYSLMAGDCRTRRYHIEVQVAPTIDVDKVVYHFPAYTGLPDQTVERQGDLRALEGTQVTLHASANSQIKAGTAEIDLGCTGRRGSTMTAEGQKATGNITLRLKTDDSAKPEYDCYQLRFADLQGRENTRPIRHRIDVSRDLSPDVELVEPKGEESQVSEDGVLTIQVRANDPDFALRRVMLRAEREGRGLLIDPLLERAKPDNPLPGEFRASYSFEPARWGLKAGDHVQCWVEAEDNKEPVANRSSSNKRWITIVGREDRKQQGQQSDGAQGKQGQPDKNGKQQPPDRRDQNSDQGQDQPADHQAQQKPEDGQQKGEPNEAPQDQSSRDGSEQPQQRNDKKAGGGAEGQDQGDPNDSRQSGDEKKRDPKAADKPNEQRGESEQKSDEKQPGDQNGKSGGEQKGAGQKSGSQQDQGGDQKKEGQSNAEQQGSGEQGADQRDGQQSADQQQAGKQSKDGQRKSGQQQGDTAADKPKERIDPETAPGDAMQEILNDRKKQEQASKGQNKDKSAAQADGQEKSDVPSDAKQQGDGQKLPNDQANSEKTADQKPEGGEPKDQQGKPDQPQPGNGAGKQEAGGEKGDKNDGQQAGDEKGLKNQAGQQGGGGGQAQGEQAADGKDADKDGKKGSDQSRGAGEKSTGQKGSSDEQSDQPQTDDNEGSNAQEGSGKEAREKSGSEPSSGKRQGTAAGGEKKQPGGEDKASQAKPGDGKTDEKAAPDQTPGAGKPSQDAQPTPGAQEGNQDRAKKPGQAGDTPGERKEGSPPSPSISKKQSDSQGDTSGDRSGGGEQGGGQQAKQRGTGGAGSHTPANQGGAKSDQSGQGEVGNQPGEESASKTPTGSAKKQTGENGTPTKPSADGKQGEASSNNKDNSTDGAQPQDQPKQGGVPGQPGSDKPNAQGQGIPTAGGKPGETKPGAPSPSGDTPADEANLEYARRQTELALEHLRDQMAKDKPGLLERLGWTKDDARRFLDRWEGMKQSANEKGAAADEARRQFKDALKSLGLRPKGTELRHGGVTREQPQNSRDASRFAPPPDWADQFRAYTRGVAGETQPDPKPPSK